MSMTFFYTPLGMAVALGVGIVLVILVTKIFKSGDGILPLLFIFAVIVAATILYVGPDFN